SSTAGRSSSIPTSNPCATSRVSRRCSRSSRATSRSCATTSRERKPPATSARCSHAPKPCSRRTPSLPHRARPCGGYLPRWRRPRPPHHSCPLAIGGHAPPPPPPLRFGAGHERCLRGARCAGLQEGGAEQGGREQAFEAGPAAGRAGGSPLDVTAHEILAVVVVDDVAAVGVEKVAPLAGARRRGERVIDQPLHGFVAADGAVQVIARRLVPRVAQLVEQLEQAVVALRFRRIEAREREQLPLLELDALVAGERELDA